MFNNKVGVQAISLTTPNSAPSQDYGITSQLWTSACGGLGSLDSAEDPSSHRAVLQPPIGPSDCWVGSVWEKQSIVQIA